MNGVITTDTLIGKINTNNILIGELSTPKSLDKYTGDYNITPTTSEITLETQNKEMIDNVIISAIEPPAWEKLADKDYEVKNISLIETLLDSINCGSEAFTKDKIIYVRIRDKAGKRNEYFYGSDTFFINTNKANNTTNQFNLGVKGIMYYSTNNGGYRIGINGTGYGIYASSITSEGYVNISTRYNSTYAREVNGTYNISIYALNLPSGKPLFDI